MPFHDVVELDGSLHLRPESAAIDAHELHADEMCSEQAHHVEHAREQRHCNHAAEKPRRDDVAHWIDGHHLHRRDLVGGAHESDLGGQRRSRTAGEQQRRDDRAELFDEPERRRDAERILGAESLQQVEALQPEHHADEQAREHHDDQRASAGVVDLEHDEARPRERRAALWEQTQQE